MRVDSIHLMWQRIDLRHGHREVWVVLVGQPDAVGLGGEPELGRISVQRGDFPGLCDLDRPVEVVGLEQLVPEPFGMQAHRLNFDPVASAFGGEDLDGLGPMRAFEHGAFGETRQDIAGVHDPSQVPWQNDRPHNLLATLARVCTVPQHRIRTWPPECPSIY